MSSPEDIVQAARRFHDEVSRTALGRAPTKWLNRFSAFLGSETMKRRYPPNVSAAAEAVYRDLIILVDVIGKLEAETEQLANRLANTETLDP
jgi:hypothetical protein